MNKERYLLVMDRMKVKRWPLSVAVEVLSEDDWVVRDMDHDSVLISHAKRTAELESVLQALLDIEHIKDVTAGPLREVVERAEHLLRGGLV